MKIFIPFLILSMRKNEQQFAQEYKSKINKTITEENFRSIREERIYVLLVV